MTDDKLKLLVGLGNPGEKYAQTRHNLGFYVLDAYLKEKAPDESFAVNNKLQSEIASFINGKNKYLLAKPLTFMNLSGQAVQKIMAYYGIAQQNLLVIHDEVDLPFGKIRFSKDSGPAGHNGVKSLIESLGTKDFARLRFGVMSEAKPMHMETSDFVLQNFSKQELAALEKQRPSLITAIDLYFKDGFDKTASQYNS